MWLPRRLVDGRTNCGDLTPETLRGSLSAKTLVAQMLYISTGQLALGNQVLLGYLLISAICSTVAFALFEVSTIFQLHDLMTLDISIKQEIGADRLIKRGYWSLA